MGLKEQTAKTNHDSKLLRCFTTQQGHLNNVIRVDPFLMGLWQQCHFLVIN